VSGYETARIADIERADGWSPIRRFFEIRSFGVNAWTGKEAGTAVIPDHDEEPTGHEELYLVIAGHANFNVDGEEIDAPVGTLVFVCDPRKKRGAIARVAATTVLSIGGKPGDAYRTRSWEINRDVFALLDHGKHAEAKRLLTEALDQYEDRTELLYNVACAEAQLGELDAALEHLRAAVTERPSFAEYAVQDGELEPLRGDPRFSALMASPDA
jgi:tetratricopeptide (TPR) repeat protein